MFYFKEIFCLVLFALLESASSQKYRFMRELKPGDTIEWAGVISKKQSPARITFFKGSNRVGQLEIQGHRNKIIMRRFGSRNVVRCLRQDEIRPKKAFQVVFKVSERLSLLIFLNKRLQFIMPLSARRSSVNSNTTTGITAARLYGPQETPNVQHTLVDSLGSILSGDTCGRVIDSQPVPGGCPRKNSTCRIVGGIPANPGSHPWQAAIRHADEFSSGTGQAKHFCGATIVGRTWAITAAHCFPAISPMTIKRFRVRVGDYNNLDGAGHPSYEKSQDHVIKRVILHHGYERNVNPENDIALIELRDPIQYNFFVLPACFPHSRNQFSEGDGCGIAGWGAQFFGQEPTSYPTCLQTAPVTIYTKQQCETWYSDVTFNSDQMMCAGNLCVDSCQGDSGGPLMCSRRARYYVWGVTSWGVRCGGRTKPGVYTRVAKYLSWIHGITNGLDYSKMGEILRGECPNYES